MPLFESKPWLSIEECCRQFYDSHIFHAIINGIDGWSIIWDTYFKSIADVDQSFLSVDPTLFRNEMTALRIELFAFACSKNSKTSKYAIRQSFFTENYLKENGRLDIRGIMGQYNQAIAMSATMNRYGKPTPGGIGRALATSVNLRRYEAVKALKKSLGTIITEDEWLLSCSNHVINFIGADIKRADSVLIKLLASRLASRLECDINLKSEAIFRLGALTLGFYKGAEEYLKSVNLQG
jgi:hypothetical protein